MINSKKYISYLSLTNFIFFYSAGLKKKKEAASQVVRGREDLYGFLPSDSETDILKKSNRNLVPTKVN